MPFVTRRSVKLHTQARVRSAGAVVVLVGVGLWVFSSFGGTARDEGDVSVHTHANASPAPPQLPPQLPQHPPQFPQRPQPHRRPHARSQPPQQQHHQQQHQAPTTTAPSEACYSHASHANASTLLDLSGAWLDTAQYHVPYTFQPKVCANSTKSPLIDPSSKAFVPRACVVERFSPMAFFDVVQGRTLFLLGDSLTLHFANTLVCLVTDPSATMRVSSWSNKELPGVEQFRCRTLTDTSSTPQRTARMCLVRVNQEISLGLWGLFQENEIGPGDVLVANTGRHGPDRGGQEVKRLIRQLPEEVRSDTSTQSPLPRVARFKRMCDWVRRQFGGKGPTFLWRTTYAAKFATKSGDYDPTQPADRRQCSSSMHGVDAQRKKSLGQARVSGLDTINAFEASALVDKDEYFGKGDCTHFAQPSTYIFTAELLLMYLRQQNRGGGVVTAGE